jgi:uncharacterized protein YbaR (Trm112 family)
MLILLTDLLACPRCGPEFGLVVLADRLAERRVLEGALGCPNCREAYPVRGAVADLRLPAGGGGGVPDAEEGDPEAAVRLAALMGLAGVAGMALVAGPGVRHAAAVAELVPELEVVAVGTRPAPGGAEARVSRVLASPGRLPFRDGMLRGGALTAGEGGEAALREGLRVLAPGTRLVVDPAPEGTAARLAALGARVMLEEAGVAVAAVPGRPVEMRRNAVR